MKAEMTISEDFIRRAAIKAVEEKYGIKVDYSNLQLHREWDGSWEISLNISYKLKEVK